MSAEPAQCAAAPYRWYVYAACTVLAVALNYAFGKDMAWDELSYHLYAGFSAVHDRFAQDYFPAGPQTYFNPYIYVPLYLLVSSDLSSLEISSVLAMVHSVMLWLTYELAVAVCPYDDKYRRLVFGLCRHHERRISAGRLAVARPRSSRAEHGAGRRCRPAVRHSYRVETDQRRSRNLGLRHSNNVAADSARAIPSGTCLRHFSGAWFSPHRRAMVLSSRAEVRQSRFSIDEPPIPLAGIYHRAAASSAFHSGLARRGSLAPVRHDRSRNDGARRNEGSGSAVCHPGGAGWRSALSLAVAASRGLLNPIGGRRRCGFGAYTYSDRLRARCGLGGLVERLRQQPLFLADVQRRGGRSRRVDIQTVCDAAQGSQLRSRRHSWGPGRAALDGSGLSLERGALGCAMDQHWSAGQAPVGGQPILDHRRPNEFLPRSLSRTRFRTDQFFGPLHARSGRSQRSPHRVTGASIRTQYTHAHPRCAAIPQ